MNFPKGENPEELRELFSAFLVGYFDKVRVRLKTYPALKEKLPEYARRGWFVSLYFGFSELDHLAQQASQLDSNHSDQLLLEMYRSSINEHSANIIKDNHERAFVIEPAIAAHNRGEYSLSVLAFFAQADGILFQKVEKQLFHGKDKERLFTLAQEKLGGESWWFSHPVREMGKLMAELIWTSHAETPPISYTEKQRKAHEYSGLNRHTVLHGEALKEYATESNSLKAFSLLSSISALAANVQES